MLWDRQRKEEREARDLSPFATHSRTSRGRVSPEEPDSLRTSFERDRDRIIHSTAFRRLEYKTQVFVFHEGDAYRTRLTHTLEAVQVARSFASALGLNETLVEAVTLAHDLGHPPFGHRGEDVLHGLMRSAGGFRHNMQSLRTVDLLERRSERYRGLNLSFEVRDALLKRPAERGGDFDPGLQPSLEAQVMDAADSTAYLHHDLEDGLRASIFTVHDLEDLAIWKRATAHLERKEPTVTGSTRVKRVVNSILHLSITDLIENSARAIEAGGIRSALEARRRASKLVHHSSDFGPEIQELHRFLYKRFYRHHRLNQMAARAERMLTLLFESYLKDPTAMPPRFQEWCEEVGRERAICDYVAGMTDRYAEEEYARFFLPGRLQR
ncbi:MAG: deoxyguanosinetriphosphate triphosphohydrolase [Planctomycetes bacterium]|nr:deoxyguanosinetriphosphate triphosphohydrolase [Planctomycetota bacterium]